MNATGVATQQNQATFHPSREMPSRQQLTALLFFAISVPLLIPLAWFIPGAIAWIISAVLTWRTGDNPFRRRMGVLLGCVLLLATAPITTDTSDRGFLVLGGYFLAVVALPAIILGRTDPGVIRFQLWPKKFRWLDIFYVAISIPLAWAVIKFYWYVNPFMPQQWWLPEVEDIKETWRLFIGINCVGIWDELFFVNTVYGVLRSIFPFKIANAAQGVVYTSVLFDMAFIGIGPIVVYIFAWTQGSMFEESENLLYVLIVHLIVDYFLFQAIAGAYYPGFSFGFH
ncbi:MAG: hypothetical protein HKN21_15730 [Candidatus Eisenbacteria bacterium]|uniref:CAAX prenyl protease 2/Lysostaphin resistance protein A-like domain-containing protein n=1 Tax=Eiseniibacteriota bacterium TaxID=2212470 RepID=A0A7Y2EE78_UNCEI|nr:hypothetical protein [Candidatus Eisenbacteria bacterium]